MAVSGKASLPSLWPANQTSRPGAITGFDLDATHKSCPASRATSAFSEASSFGLSRHDVPSSRRLETLRKSSANYSITMTRIQREVETSLPLDSDPYAPFLDEKQQLSKPSQSDIEYLIRRWKNRWGPDPPRNTKQLGPAKAYGYPLEWPGETSLLW
jgi:hypothetical protein